MKILILTGRFGMGHYSVAEALYEEIEKKHQGIEVEIIDIVDYMFSKWSKGIYKSFNFMASKCSFIYNLYCGTGDKKIDIPLKTYISDKMSKIIDEKGVDLIISTLPLSSQFVGI